MSYPPNQPAPFSAPHSNPAPHFYGRSSEVVRTGSWMVTLLLLGIPIVGLIMVFVWAFGDSSNLNKRNLCRAHLVLSAILIGIMIFFAILSAVLGS